MQPHAARSERKTEVKVSLEKAGKSQLCVQCACCKCEFTLSIRSAAKPRSCTCALLLLQWYVMNLLIPKC